MPADPWSACALLATFAMWVLMMGVMMLPAATPVLRVIVAATAAPSPSRLSVPVVLAGYLLVWTAFSALATVAQASLAAAGLLGADLRATDGRLASVFLALAGGYQFSPWKLRFLSHCAHPIALLLRHPGGDARASVAMGMRYGITCIGCCAPLMLVLFAVGVMNVAWIVAITVFVLAERYGIGGAMLSRAAGGALVAYAVYTAAV